MPVVDDACDPPAASNPTADAPVIVPDAVRFDLGAIRGGKVWRVFLAIPREDPPPAGFPVIYLLDANAAFATLVESLRRGMARPQATGLSPAVIVGIGYPVEGRHDHQRRSFDYTVGPEADPAPAHARRSDATFGGRDAFLAFIEDTLKPEIARRCAVDSGRQTLIGHSLAGFFVLDVMLRNRAAFRSYVAISPSIWWDEPRLDAGLHAATETERPGELGLFVGEWEQTAPPWHAQDSDADGRSLRRAERRMVDRSRDFAARATQRLSPTLDVRFAVLPEEDHASVLPTAMIRALRLVLAPPQARSVAPPST